MTIYFILYSRTYKDGKYVIIILNNIIRFYLAFFESVYREPIRMCVDWIVGNQFGCQFSDMRTNLGVAFGL